MLKSKLTVVWLIYALFLSSCGIDLAGTPPFDDLTFSNGYSDIAAPDGRTWEVTFEFPKDSIFTGVVRHTSRWYDSSVPFMSHDILITTDDYASQDFVDVSVFDHKFFYHYQDASNPPQGSIHLLHIFPASKEVFEQLKQIQDWNNVSIRGREILKIDLFDADGKSKGFFMDMGCNTILVTSVTVNAEGTPVP
jgi:hypothetical protein